MTWPTARDLAGLPGLPTTERGVRKRAAAEGWAAQATPTRGGLVVRYRPESLPAAVRLALAARQSATTHAAEPAAVPAPGSAAAAAPAALIAAPARPMSERDTQRMRVLVLAQRWWQAVGGALTPALESFCLAWDAGRIDAPAELRAEFPRLPFSTLRRWWFAVAEQGTLTRRTHPRRGQYNALQGDVGTAVLAILSRRPHLSAASVRGLLVAQGWADLPSERAFQRAIAAFKAQHAAAWLAHTNPDAWRSHHLAAGGDAAAHITAPNHEWQMDSTVGDVQLVDPETGEIRRHHLVAVIDVFTRRAMFLVTRTSRANAIAALIRRAIAAWGMPRRIKTDNGADYTAQALEFSLLQLGIEHPLCEPFQPQQKPFVERVFGTLLHGLFPLLDGFVGHSVAQRKAIESVRSFEQRLMGRGGEGVELRLSPAQLQTMVDNWTADYCAATHSSLGCSPDEMTQRHVQQLVRVDERALDLFLAPVAADEIRTVVKKGVRLERGWYDAAELAGHEGQQVRCRMADDEIGHVYVFGLDGAYICRATDSTRLGVSRGEVAQRRKAKQREAVSEFRANLREAARQYDVDAAVRDIYLHRQQQAVQRGEQAGQVTRLKPREVQHSTPAISSALEGLQRIQPATDAAPQRSPQMQAAVAAAQAPRAPVFRVGDTPNARYSAWLRLQARVGRGEAVSPAERSWMDAFATSSEWRAMDRLHSGADPLAAEGGG